MLSHSEENYLKTIFHLSGECFQEVSTNAIAEHIKTKPASVSDMLKKLAIKELIEYEKYQGVKLSESGRKLALSIVRKHRLWELFLVDKLGFHWDQVHEVAEQLEHIKSELLTERLDDFLGHPTHDPHGDPIPDKKGYMKIEKFVPLSDCSEKEIKTVANVKDTSPLFLQHLDKIGVSIGSKIKVKERISFDSSLIIEIDSKNQIAISKEIALNILVQ